MKTRIRQLLFLVYSLAVVTALFCFHIDYFPSTRPAEALPFRAMPPSFFNGVLELVDNSPVSSTYRGTSEHHGTSEGIMPLQVTKQTLLPRLNVGIHGASKASPAVDASGIYVGGDSGWFYAVNHDGSVRWRYYATDSPQGIHSTAALDQNTVYFGTYAGDLIAADKSNGQIRWITKVGESIGSSPALVGDLLVVAVETNAHANGYVVGLNRRDGSLKWKSEYLGEQSHASPTIDLTQGLAFVGANNAAVFAFRLADGVTAWKQMVDGKVKSTMALIDGHLYFTTWGNSLYSISAATGAPEWKAPLAGRSQSSPSWVPDRDVLILGSEPGFIYGFERRSGRELWRMQTGWITSRFPSALVVKRTSSSASYLAWIGCGEKKLCVIDPANGKTLRTVDLPGLLTGVPVFFAGRIFLALNESGLQVLRP